MIKVNIFYPNKDGGRFDLAYYLTTHMPMAIEKLGPFLKGVSIPHLPMPPLLARMVGGSPLGNVKAVAEAWSQLLLFLQEHLA
jgi:hypothetical protein